MKQRIISNKKDKNQRNLLNFNIYRDEFTRLLQKKK